MTNDDTAARHTLPISDREFEGRLSFDAKDPSTTFPPIEPLRPPPGAPNVLVVLLDDVGFAASSAFGGPCHTPTAERLASAGLVWPARGVWSMPEAGQTPFGGEEPP